MANKEHLEILKQGVEAWNRWREENPGVRPDLSGGDLGEMDFFEAALFGANLNKANLSEAFLLGANLFEANLSGANLSRAILFRADLSLADLSKANLNRAHIGRTLLHGADLSEADLSDCDMQVAQLIETNLRDANLTGCHIYGISAWSLQLEGTIQTNLVITPDDEPDITVDNLEVAQFIYLLLNNDKVRDVINTITTKVVLILGRFTPERKTVLDAIREELRNHDLLPVLFDFDKPATRDIHETVTTLARMARFVIADITDPKSIPQELVSIVEQLPSLAVQPILQEGYEPWGMYDHIKRYPWVLAIHHYRDLDDLLASLEEKVIGPAEAKATESQV